MDIILSWSEFKAEVISVGFPINHYKTHNDMSDADAYGYVVFAVDRNVLWQAVLSETDDITDFETNYKSKSNKCMYSNEGKMFVRAESRPMQCTTCFTTCGDVVGETPQIGGGSRLFWDASKESEWTTEGAPEGMKQCTVTIQFCDSIWLKEGTIYWMNGHKDAYIDMEVLCPPGLYFMYQGEIRQNTTEEDMVVDHYLFKSALLGSCPMGDELNTESCSQELPSYLKYRMTVTLPVGVTDCYGAMQMELYRVRTIVLS